MTRRGERGLALIVVLWGIAALSLIAFAMLGAGMSAARVSHNAWTQLQVKTAADSALQGALLSLFDPEPSGQPPLDGTPRETSADGIAMTVSVQDEAGRIDINEAGRGTLALYFKAAGVGAADADALAGHVVDWRSPGGAPNTDGGAANIFHPRRAPFQSVDEIGLIPGVTPALFQQIAGGLTVYSHRPNFDARTAPVQVLEAIPGMNKSSAAAMATARTRVAARPGHAFTIAVAAERGPVRYLRRAVILITGDTARPYMVLDWR